MKRFEIIDGKCVIPEGTDYIEDYEFHCSAGAFAECAYLWSVNIPAGVTCIAAAARKPRFRLRSGCSDMTWPASMSQRKLMMRTIWRR